MARGLVEVTFHGRLFEPTMTKRVVGILNRYVKDTAQHAPREISKRMRRGRGRDTGRLARAFAPGRLVRDLEARSDLWDKSVERYVHRVEYGTPAYGVRGQGQRRLARKALIRRLSPKKLGAELVRELNG